MTTFFVIFFVLILVNAALLFHSSFITQGSGKSANHIDKQPDIKVYSIDRHSSDYKKAI